MQLQKRLSRKIGTKEYIKWVITIPPEEVKKLEWKAGQVLDARIENGILIIKKKKK